MGKRWSPGLFCFALLIAFDSAFAAQTEAITENERIIGNTYLAMNVQNPI